MFVYPILQTLWTGKLQNIMINLILKGWHYLYDMIMESQNYDILLKKVSRKIEIQTSAI